MSTPYSTFRVPPSKMSRSIRTQVSMKMQAWLELQAVARLHFLGMLLHSSLDVFRSTSALKILDR